MSSESLPARVEGNELAHREQPHPLDLIKQAIESGIDADSMATLCDLAHKQEDRTAAREFADGLMQFQSEVPAILKSKEAKIASKRGGSYSYRFAPLDAIDRVVKPILGRLGFAYSWDSRIDGALMTVTCTLRHVNGHRESASFSCPTDSPNPGMSGQQKHAGAMSFARRQTLTAVLGLTTTDPDDDGCDPTPLNIEQAATVNDMIEAAAEASGVDSATTRARFLTYMDAGTVEEILASDYNRALNALRAKGAK